MYNVKLDPKVKELKKRADRFIDWYISQQEEVKGSKEKKRLSKVTNK